MVDVGPNFLMALFMAFVVYLVGKWDINIYVLLVVQILLGIILYGTMAILTKNESLTYVVSYLKKRFIKR